MANTLSFTDISTILNSIYQQATGQQALTIASTADFVAVANATLLTGYDQVLGAISQVMDRTIFSVRPYSAKFGGIRVDERRFGNHTRKLAIIDKPFEADERYFIQDGDTGNMFKVNLPKVLQTNFYGGQTFQKSYTWMKDQLDMAFRSPEELAQFWSMATQNVSDMIEQAHESMARGAIANFIAGKASIDTGNVIHLLTEYNAATGQELTATTVMAPDTYPAFMKWVYARIAQLCSMLTERSSIFHVNIGDKVIQRHTPYANQRIFLYSGARYQIENMVLADIYHDNYLRMAVTESVNFWQSIKTPDEINVTASIINPGDGQVTGDTQNVKDIFGLIIDEEAVGHTTINQWSGTTPFDVKDGFATTYYHFTDRFWNDFTENGIVLLLN